MSVISKRTRNQQSFIIEEVHQHGLLVETREVFLHGNMDDVDGDPGVDWRMANKFIKNMRLLENMNGGPIVIHQHSIGGEFSDGMAIYDMICKSPCQILIIMHGTACSMGSIIPQAADKRIIMPNCEFMIHDGSTGLQDSLTYKQAQSWAEHEQKQLEIMMNIYCDVCQYGVFFQKEQMVVKQIRKFLDEKRDLKEDWILNAREAVRFGFADAVLGDEEYETINVIKDSL